LAKTEPMSNKLHNSQISDTSLFSHRRISRREKNSSIGRRLMRRPLGDIPRPVSYITDEAHWDTRWDGL